MTRTALDHPLVAAYLRQLDAALAVLPVTPARELREQITGHLDEALAPDAADQEVAGVLQRLGAPGDLASEAAATAGKRPWLARLGWRRWALIAMAVVLTTGVAGYVVTTLGTGPLIVSGTSSWWYPQDASREADISADGQSQTMVPIRLGQRQGFLIQVFNTTGRTQTVLGPVGAFGIGSSPYHVSMSPDDPDHIRGTFRSLRYGAPVPVPPHQSRYLRVLWISRACLEKGSLQGSDQLSLRVRVGLFTRTENLQLNQGWYLAGPDSCG
jgi:hypothetical protein